ncbi:hypothetical protein BC749_107131 [Flavobacterium araucananum]|uniref:Uncharacterized protein n=3 Tax=Flavobacterium araucananum TaxID=946678 RepID=A0A227PAH2_9FLAO|nr:hypothetical protein B0A64_08830 [Flavobacterium araucananum]PWJ97334.1 hypothetical protein BC749_107131 [Flavobacterium araucananum]
MLKKTIFLLLTVLLILPFFFWNQITGIIIVTIEIILILLYKRQNLFARIFISILICFYSHWIYFNLSGFLMTHYFSIKELIVAMNQTKSDTFETKNNLVADPQTIKILKEMESLDFYFAQIDANHNKITFSINGKHWTGKESAENAFIYTRFTFFHATTYPTKVYINAYDD